MSKLFYAYRKDWPRVGAVAAMTLGGASVLAFTRKKPGNLRALAVMNSMTRSTHQYEEYVDPGISRAWPTAPCSRATSRVAGL